MNLYMIVIEDEYGMFANEPRFFEVISEAETYAFTKRDDLKPGQAWILYECRAVDSLFERPQTTSQNTDGD